MEALWPPNGKCYMGVVISTATKGRKELCIRFNDDGLERKLKFHQVGQLEFCCLIELHDVVLTSKSFQQL